MPLTVLQLLSTLSRPGLQTLVSGLPLRHPDAASAPAGATSGPARAMPITAVIETRRRVRLLIGGPPGTAVGLVVWTLLFGGYFRHSSQWRQLVALR